METVKFINKNVLIGLGLLVVMVIAKSSIDYWERDFGWDEAIYYSHTQDDVPDPAWASTRSKGILYMLLPCHNNCDLGQTRKYLFFLSSLFMSLILLLWYRLIGTGVFIGVGIFILHWMNIYYSSMLLNNYYFALLIVITLGSYLNYIKSRKIIYLVGFVLSAVAAVVLRLPDGMISLAIIGLLYLGELFGDIKRNVKDSKESLLKLTIQKIDWKLIFSFAIILALAFAPWLYETYSEYGGLQDRFKSRKNVRIFNPKNPIDNFFKLMSIYSGKTEGYSLFNILGLAVLGLQFVLLVISSFSKVKRLRSVAIHSLALIIGSLILYTMLVDHIEPRYTVLANILLSLVTGAFIVNNKKILKNYLLLGVMLLAFGTYCWWNYEKINKSLKYASNNSLIENAVDVATSDIIQDPETIILAQRRSVVFQVYFKRKVFDLRKYKKCSLFKKFKGKPILVLGKDNDIKHILECGYTSTKIKINRFANGYLLEKI